MLPLTGLSLTISFTHFNRCFTTFCWVGSAVFILPKLDKELKGLKDVSICFREPVSCFTEDSVYTIAPPQVDEESRKEFHIHVTTGEGQVRQLHRDDMLMYREYVRNRYMWAGATKNLVERPESSFLSATLSFLHKGAFCFYLFCSCKITSGNMFFNSIEFCILK